jgi:hypothetical protein
VVIVPSKKINMAVYAGVSIFNTLQPEYAFLNSNYEREMRLNTHAGALITN